jgi:hypothetical protein
MLRRIENIMENERWKISDIEIKITARKIETRIHATVMHIGDKGAAPFCRQKDGGSSVPPI